MPPENFDLNLIRVFLAVARCRSVTEAGLQLGLTQSSVSHALGRLRGLCNDRLFVNTREGMLPTATASAMVEPLTEALALATRTFQGAPAFEPRTDARHFSLVLSEIGEMSYLPRLVEYLSAHAPRITLSVLQVPLGEHYEALLQGRADLTIGTYVAEQPGFREDLLFEQPYVCMLRADHPTIGDTLSMAQYFAASHVTVEPPGRGPGLVELALAAMGRERNIVIRLPHFLAGPLILRRSDYLMSVPERTWRVLGSPDYVKCLPLPFETPLIAARCVWHERSQGDPAHRWFRETVRQLLCAPEFLG